MNWYVDVLKKYALFDGRASRQEYWMFTLFNVLALIVLGVIAVVGGDKLGAIAVAPYLLYALGTLLPNLAVTVRRLHDSDKSGWMILVSFIPFVGGLILLFFMIQEGTRGSNQFGRDPLRVAKRRRVVEEEDELEEFE